MAHSYAYLCKKARLPAPVAEPLVPAKRPYRKRKAKQDEALRAFLEKMVEAGELTKDDQGRYGLPEWQKS